MLSEQQRAIVGRAVELLETEGWCQYHWERETRRGTIERCLGGSLFKALQDLHAPLGVPERDLDYYSEIVSALRSNLREKGWPMSYLSWNDAPGRTKEEVLDLLRSVLEDR